MDKVLRNKFVQTTSCEYEAVAKVLDRRTLSGTSPVVAEYEGTLCRQFGSSHAIACSSGTSALLAALLALDVGASDEVVLPPTAPVMTALPIVVLGATPVFVDVVRGGFGFDFADLRAAATPRTKAIVSVPMWGYPCWDREVEAFARSMEIPIIEDAAQAHGSISDGRHVGTLGRIGCFSTHERKLVCTGEGGFLLTDDENLSDRIREVCMFGRQVVARPNLEQYVGKFGAALGLNFKLSAVCAAIGICQVQRLEDRISIRTRNAACLREKLGSVQWLREVPIPQGARANYYAIVFDVDPRFGSGTEVAARLAERGVISDTFDYEYAPLYTLPVFRRFARDCPNAEALTKRLITLPTHEGLSTDDLDFMAEMVASLDPDPRSRLVLTDRQQYK